MGRAVAARAEGVRAAEAVAGVDVGVGDFREFVGVSVDEGLAREAEERHRARTMALEEALEASVGGADFWLDAEAKGVATERAQWRGAVTRGVEGLLDRCHCFAYRFLAGVLEDGAGDDARFEGLEIGNDVVRWRLGTLAPRDAGQKSGGAHVFAEVDPGTVHGAVGPRLVCF